MTTRIEREKKQIQNNHFKKVLSQLIAKEENKFCADCLAKGPRWASWNLGVLLCIRCSGIHRSLGVHISKVKSVNLDTWTTDQLVSMCQRGNGWAKEKYEAKLPKEFKRPQSNSSMEYFIRDKYERLKYSTNSEIPLRSIDEFNIYMTQPNSNSKPKDKKKDLGNGIPIIRSFESARSSNPERKQTTTNTNQQKQPAPATTASTIKQTNNTMDDLLGLNSPPAIVKSEVTSQPSNDLPADLFASVQPTTDGNASSLIFDDRSSVEISTSSSEISKQMSKDSILSLYSQNQTVGMMQHNPYISAGPYTMPGQNHMMFGQQNPNIGFQPGFNYSNQMNMNQGIRSFPQQQQQQQQPMQGFQQLQAYNWQQQQMQQQMQKMNLGDMNRSMQYGGMRTCSSMPQMSQQQPGGFIAAQSVGNNDFLTAPANNSLTNSQPSLSGFNAFQSWNGNQTSTSGHTLSSQLWK